ncbi:MAG TPA: F0F1 ATP synthase subunit delta [Cellvibrionaceae bacterium]
MAEPLTFARPYARAAFQFALEAGDLDAWAEQLTVLSACSQDATLKKVIGSPAYTGDQQAEILVGVVGEGLTTAMRNFLQLLAKNKRLSLLAHIARMFHDLKTQHENAVDVQLTTAMELDSATEKKLINALTQKLSRKVTVKTQVDQRLLAGVVIKAGDLVIDASMRGRLEQLAKAINS